MDTTAGPEDFRCAPGKSGDGSYWTGYQYANRVIWPRERTTWTAGALLLAHAALSHHVPTHATFMPTATASVAQSHRTRSGQHHSPATFSPPHSRTIMG